MKKIFVDNKANDGVQPAEVSLETDNFDDKWHIFIRTDAGKRFKLVADPSDTIKDVKTKIQSKDNIPIEQQKLFLNKEELEQDQRTLKE